MAADITAEDILFKIEDDLPVKLSEVFGDVEF